MFKTRQNQKKWGKIKVVKNFIAFKLIIIFSKVQDETRKNLKKLKRLSKKAKINGNVGKLMEIGGN